MTRKAFINFLLKQLVELSDEGVIKLVLSKRYEAVEEILGFWNYEVFDRYTDNKKFKKIKMSEIPDEYVLLFVIYLFGDRTDETMVLENKKELIERLLTSMRHKTLCKKIAYNLQKNYLFEFDNISDLVQ